MDFNENFFFFFKDSYLAVVWSVYNLTRYNDSITTPEGYFPAPPKKNTRGALSSSYPPAVGFLIKKAELLPAQNTSKDLSLVLHLTCSFQHLFFLPVYSY